MNLTTTYTNTNQYKFLLDFQVSLDSIPQDDLFFTILDITERININQFFKCRDTGYRTIDRAALLRCVLLSFAEGGYLSTRQLAAKSATDVRYMFLLHNTRVSHQTFHNFIHDELKDSVESIFYELNKAIEEELNINTAVLHIDGTKFEANANKMSFVWKKSTKRYHSNAWKKFIELVRKLNRFYQNNNVAVTITTLKQPDIPFMIEVGDTIQKYMSEHEIPFTAGRGHKKHEIQKIYEELLKIFSNILKYTMYFDILGDRNSFSKTDPDATFMHMKYDYYNHTGVFKPGYNVQFGVSDEFIRSIYISSDCNDLATFIPHLKLYKEAYGTYPLVTPADAGYGSHDNYRFCKENGIDLLMKYSGFYKEQEKTTDKNRFQAKRMLQSDGNYMCPNNKKFIEVSRTENHKGIYDREIITYECEECEGCPLKSKCTRAKKNRKIQVCPETEAYRKEAKENIESDYGQLLMFGRSAQAEGAFGIIKEDYRYTRLRRRGETMVKLEIYMVAIGFNLRKYHSRIKKSDDKEALA